MAQGQDMLAVRGCRRQVAAGCVHAGLQLGQCKLFPNSRTAQLLSQPADVGHPGLACTLRQSSGRRSEARGTPQNLQAAGWCTVSAASACRPTLPAQARRCRSHRSATPAQATQQRYLLRRRTGCTMPTCLWGWPTPRCWNTAQAAGSWAAH
jgi:hypothetical protein